MSIVEWMDWIRSLVKEERKEESSFTLLLSCISSPTLLSRKLPLLSSLFHRKKGGRGVDVDGESCRVDMGMEGTNVTSLGKE